MRISDWSSDVCSSDLQRRITFSQTNRERNDVEADDPGQSVADARSCWLSRLLGGALSAVDPCRPRSPRHRADRAQPCGARSEEHTSELQSLMRISYAVFCLKKKKTINTTYTHYE